MSCCSEHHKKLTNGVGKCSVPMWDGHGMPYGFCDEPAFGEQTPEGKLRTNKLHVPYLVCPRHGGPAARAAEPERKGNDDKRTGD